MRRYFIIIIAIIIIIVFNVIIITIIITTITTFKVSLTLRNLDARNVALISLNLCFLGLRCSVASVSLFYLQSNLSLNFVS